MHAGGRMIKVDEKENIRRLYFIKRHSIRWIAREHHYSRKTVRKAISDASVPEYHLSTPKPRRVVGPYEAIIKNWLEEDDEYRAEMLSEIETAYSNGKVLCTFTTNPELMDRAIVMNINGFAISLAHFILSIYHPSIFKK